MRVLYLTHRLPYAPNRGDRIRAYHTLRVLRDHAQVEVVSLVHDAAEASHVSDLRDLADRVHLAPVRRLRNWAVGASRVATRAPLTHALLHSSAVAPALRQIVSERPPDVVLAYCSGMARFAVQPPLDRLPLVLDMVDVDSVKWRTLATGAGPPIRLIYAREAHCLSRFEARMARRAFATTVVNERERAELIALAPDARVEIVPVGVDSEYFRPPSEPTDEQKVVFCGVMNYAPNVEGAVWLARTVWPLVRRRCVGARLQLVGSEPTSLVRSLASTDSGIEVTGRVPDVPPYLWSAAVATAPLNVARGVQTKVLEALAAGLPTIVTPVVAAGLPCQVLAGCRVANGADAFAAAIVETLNLQPRVRREIAARAETSRLSWDRQLQPLVGLLQSAIGAAVERAEA